MNLFYDSLIYVLQGFYDDMYKLEELILHVKVKKISDIMIVPIMLC